MSSTRQSDARQGPERLSPPLDRAAISFAIERKRHEGFVGRDRLLAWLDELLIADSVDRWVVVTGGPGMGKSAVLAAWLARREAARETVPHHFIRRGWANWDEPDALVGSLVAQLDARFPDARESDADARLTPAARLAAALLRASEHALVPRGERLVLLIDGLDEYDPRPGSLAGDPLAAFLPYSLPHGVSVLCASRPRHPYVDSLATRGVLVQIDLDDAQRFAADNAATVRAFWAQGAPELGLDAPFVAQAVERAGGNLQHAAMLRRQLAGMPPDQRHVDDIPRGLMALIASAWERIASDPAVVDGLGILCAAREPLTLDELGRVARWTAAASRQAFVRGAREWLIETRRSSRVSDYRLHHDAIRAHITDAIGTDALAAHHLALAERLAIWPAPADATARRYALHHALLHRAEAGAWADAWRVAADMAFLEAKCRELGVHDAEADVAQRAARCRASGDEAHVERFADLARALGRESHWLRAAPEATAALVWNRLRRLGWSAGELYAQLRVPEGMEFLRVRHAATRESPALVRSLEGHAGVVTACAVTPDGRHVVSASGATLYVWEFSSGRGVATLEGHADWVVACAVTRDGTHLVSASEDQTLKVWELVSGRAVATLAGHTNVVTACVVTRDGRHVVSASADKTLKVWELMTGRAVATLKGHTDRVNACAVTPDGRHVVSASMDQRLKVWELVSGRAVATLIGHTDRVNACAVTPDGRYVVSASRDKTLKVWDLATYACCITHRGDASYLAVATNATTIVAGDTTGAVWFLDWPWSKQRQPAAHDEGNDARHLAATPAISPSLPRLPMKHTILYLAANPLHTDRLALDEECAAIERELRMTSSRDDFDFRSKWAVSVDDLMRHLNELQPTVLHFSGHGSTDEAGSSVRSGDPRRDITGARSAGILLQDGQSHQFVSDRALAKMIASAAPSTRVVVLNACYSAEVADSLRQEVDCVVGIGDAIADTAARSFAVAFYRALGHRRSIGNAVDQAAATLEAKHPGARPGCATRDGLRADQIFLPSAERSGPAPEAQRAGAAARSKVDIAILTILEEEFRAVLAAFPDRIGAFKGTRTNREYSLHRADVGGGAHYALALLRQIEQGNGEAQSAARDLIEDLAPRLILVVGIAGGLPSASVTLGDVVLSTRIHDFTVEARNADQSPTYATTGGPVSKALAAAIANLPAREAELGAWAHGLPAQPPVSWTGKDQLYGPKDWQAALRTKLERHHGGETGPRTPIYVDGPIASSDRLVKDPALLIPWLQTARKLVAVEMESGGVYRAAQDRCSMLAIRGISDIVGLKRSDAWTRYACASAAAFARAFLRTRPVGDPW